MSIASKFLNWLYKRSPHNAADPNPSAMPYDQDVNDIPFNESQIIEMSIEQDVIIGIPLSFGDEDTIARGPNRELIRSHKKISILCGCGHIPSQLHAEKDAGKSLDPAIEKMNELVEHYAETSRPMYCAKQGFVDEIVRFEDIRKYMVAFANGAYQNPKSICPQHHMILPRLIRSQVVTGLPRRPEC